MTEIRVNSVLPAVMADSARSFNSGSDFASSFQSVSAADLGSEARVSQTGTSTDSGDQIFKPVSSAVNGSDRTPDNSANQSAVQNGVQNDTDFKKAQTASSGSDTVPGGQNSLSEDTTEDLGFQITVSGGAEQTVKEAEGEFSELQNHVVKTDGADINAKSEAKPPMLDLDRIIESLESFVGSDSQGKDTALTEIGENSAEIGQAVRETLPENLQFEQDNSRGAETAKDLHGSGENAPVIDLDRILAGLGENGQPQSDQQTKDIPLTAPLAEEVGGYENVDVDADKEQTTALPQINFEKILESVNGAQEGDEVIPSADEVNAAEAENGVKRSETTDSDRIAANVGLVWDGLTSVITAAAKSLEGTENTDDDKVTELGDVVVGIEGIEKVQWIPSDVPIKSVFVIEFMPDGSAQDADAADKAAGGNAELGAFLLGEISQTMAQEEKPVTLEELRTMLSNAIRDAINELNDPEKQQEELEEKILEFLLKFLEKMNEDEDDGKTAPNGEKGEDLGILLVIIENMLDELREAREAAQITDSENKGLEIAPSEAVEGVKNEYGVNGKADADKFTDTDKKAAVTEAENKTERGISGAAEGLYTPAADVNADRVGSEAKVSNISPAYENLTVSSVQTGISKVDENADSDDLNAKAEKVLSKQSRNGTIRNTELPDEFAELRKLIDDMKKTHDDEEEPEDDEEEKEIGVGGKSVKGDEKSDIIRAVSVKSSEPGEAALAKSFSMERSGAKQILSQIASEILNNMPKEKRTVALVMTLTPENLGKVTLKITEQAGKLNVAITAHNKETAEILASRMDGLQEALKDSGTQLEKYQVVYGPEEEADARQQSYEGSSKNPYVRDDEEEGTDKDGEFFELLQRAV